MLAFISLNTLVLSQLLKSILLILIQSVVNFKYHKINAEIYLSQNVKYKVQQRVEVLLFILLLLLIYIFYLP